MRLDDFNVSSIKTAKIRTVVCNCGYNEKNKTIIIFFFIFIPKGQTSRVNIMANLKSLKELPNTRVFIAVGEWIVRSIRVGGFISPQNVNLRR